MSIRVLLLFLDKKLRGLKRRLERMTLPDFAGSPQRLCFEVPRRITNPGHIEIGDDCYIGPGSSVTACGEVGAPFCAQRFEGRIKIGNRVWATRDLQVFAAALVEIEDDVMLAGNVFICDYQHGHARVDLPYKYQPFEPVLPVKIGAGSWIGQNVVIMPGVEIGRQAIIGANSVVTRSVPAGTIAAGSPARVVRCFDVATGKWMGPSPGPVGQPEPEGRHE